jgi:hypothetical protein
MSPWDGGPSRVSHQLSAQIRLNPLIRANFWQQKRLTSSRPAPIWNTQNNEIVVNQLWITWGLYHTKCKRSIRKSVVVQNRRFFGVRSREVFLVRRRTWRPSFPTFWKEQWFESPLGCFMKILEYSPMMSGSFSLSCGSSLRCRNHESRSCSAALRHEEATYE